MRFDSTQQVSGPTTGDPDLSIVIPAAGATTDLASLVLDLRDRLSVLGIRSEILVVSDRRADSSLVSLGEHGAEILLQGSPGYGSAVKEGLLAAKGTHILTVDPDFSHPPAFVEDLWANRLTADIVIASRYVAGGEARVPAARYVLSRLLNLVFSRGLSLHIKDMSSGFRLYRAGALQATPFTARNLDILQEILVRAYANGWTVREIPFKYAPRRHSSAAARVLSFGIDYIRTFWRLWLLRNSILSADYDDRAYDSPIFLQRFWQRSRFRHLVQLAMTEGRVLDVGCGSSRVIGALRPDSIALDLLYRKLRYGRRYGRPLVHASGFSLPFPDNSFPCVLCSQVIEHVPKDSPILSELDRVLAPGGRLILGTPDYAHWEWRITERLYGAFAPGAYADEHIAHYTRAELLQHFSRLGYRLEETRYILRGEMILALRKP